MADRRSAQQCYDEHSVGTDATPLPRLIGSKGCASLRRPLSRALRSSGRSGSSGCGSTTDANIISLLGIDLLELSVIPEIRWAGNQSIGGQSSSPQSSLGYSNSVKDLFGYI
jgi:hypothetical protein